MTTNPIPEQYQTDILVLLVGTNPLPNYVAACLLLKQAGQLCLVYSKDTALAADCLEDLLQKKQIITKKPTRLVVEEANANDIYANIEGHLKKSASGSTVGLHYTGGTKMMAVHAYRAVQAATSGKAICTYLNARTYEMVFDPVGTSYPPSIKVLTSVEIGLRELLQLHLLELTKDSLSQAVPMPRSITALAQLCGDPKQAEEWRKWCAEELREKTQGKKDWKRETHLKEVVLTWPTEEMFAPAVTAICAELETPVGQELALSGVTQNGKFKEIKHFCQWLDGKWLEEYTLSQIAQVREACGLGDYGCNLSTKEKVSAYDFEFDVAVMRGYQLFGFSCTTDASLTKSKLFEAYIRAPQLGGDEARAAVVCPHKKPETTQRHLEQLWGAQDKIRVFGAEHLRELAKHLKTWFKTTDQR